MRDLTLQESRDYTYEGRCRLWGQDVFVGLDLPEGEDKARALEAALPAVEQRLEWLENNRAGVEKALLDDGGPDLAQDWASSAELAEEEDGGWAEGLFPHHAGGVLRQPAAGEPRLERKGRERPVPDGADAGL